MVATNPLLNCGSAFSAPEKTAQRRHKFLRVLDFREVAAVLERYQLGALDALVVGLDDLDRRTDVLAPAQE